MSEKLRNVGMWPSANDALFHGRRDVGLDLPRPPGGGVMTAYLGMPGQSIQVHYAKDLALPERALLHRLGLLHPIA